MLNKLVFILLVSLSMSSARAAVTWDWNGFSLRGAHNVDVGGVLYDVAFMDGTCIELFDGCNELSDFMFTTQEAAILASQSLLDQVFLDINPVGQPFDSVPSLIEGCVSSSPVFCDSMTPFGFSTTGGVFVVSAQNTNTDFFNFPDLYYDRVKGDTQSGYDPAYHTANSFPFVGQHESWAVWSPASIVPVPSALWLFGSGLLGLIGFTKRNKT